MRRLVQVIALSVFVCISGSSISIAAEDVSGAEKSIKQTLSNYAEAWNKKDVKGVISFYHDNADIMTGKEKKMVSKQQYEQILPNKWKFGKIKFGVPKIKVTRDKANVKVKATFKRFDANFTYAMVLQDNSWLIMVQKY